jgi:hypothetical protein
VGEGEGGACEVEADGERVAADDGEGVALPFFDGEACELPALCEGEAEGEAAVALLGEAEHDKLGSAKETDALALDDGAGDAETASHAPPLQASVCVNSLVSCMLASTTDEASSSCSVSAEARTAQLPPPQMQAQPKSVVSGRLVKTTDVSTVGIASVTAQYSADDAPSEL